MLNAQAVPFWIVAIRKLAISASARLRDGHHGNLVETAGHCDTPEAPNIALAPPIFNL